MSDKQSITGDGVQVTLADGKDHEIRFSARTIIRCENTWGSHEGFMAAMQASPVGTLAALLFILKCGTEDECMDLLDGVNWRGVRDDVTAAWKKASWVVEPDPFPQSGE